MRCSPSRLSKTQTDGEAAVPLEGKKHRQNKEGTEDGKYQNNFANEMLCLLLLKQVPAEPAAFLSLALACPGVRMSKGKGSCHPAGSGYSGKASTEPCTLPQLGVCQHFCVFGMV